jgi:hypothetical protein
MVQRFMVKNRHKCKGVNRQLTATTKIPFLYLTSPVKIGSSIASTCVNPKILKIFEAKS